jgi:uridine kinase
LPVSIESVVQAIQQTSVSGGGPVLVAIDGRSGVGKSTLAAELARKLDAAVVSGDDFFAGGADEEWARRSPEERAAWCIDWRRLRDEALEPLLAGRSAAWRPFYALGPESPPVTVAPKPVIVLDGAYSGRPELADIVGVAVLVVVRDDETRRRRLIAREGEPFMAAWHSLWDAAEDHYFSKVARPARFDFVIESSSEDEPGA